MTRLAHSPDLLLLASLLCSAVTGAALPAAADEGSITPVSIAGIDPRIYLRSQKREPRAALELRRLPVDHAVAILEGNAERYLFDRKAYPLRLAPVELELLREEETRALVEGALAAVAARKHPRARALIEDWLLDDDIRVRAEAVERYGEVGGDTAVLAELATDPDPRVRTAACVGLGKLRSDAGIDALLKLARDGSDAERQAAAVRGLGVAASAPPQGAADPRAQQELATRVRLGLILVDSIDPGVSAALDDVTARLR